MRWLSLALLFTASSCVLGHFSQRGEQTSKTEVDRRVNDGSRELKVEGGTAKIGFERNTCVAYQSSYTKEFYKKTSYPAQIITPIGLAVAFAGFITAIASPDPGFFWPESRPAITPISWAVAGVFGVATLLAGLVPMGAGAVNPRDTLLRTEQTTEYDRVDTSCSTREMTLSGSLPYVAWLYGEKVKAKTPSSGELNFRKAAITGLWGEKLTPFRLRMLEEDAEVMVSFELAGTKEQIETVDLYEVRIYADTVGAACSEACIEAGEAKLCKVRERICREEGGFSDICVPMRNTCLERESKNKEGFERCFDACAKKRFKEIFDKK